MKTSEIYKGHEIDVIVRMESNNEFGRLYYESVRIDEHTANGTSFRFDPYDTKTSSKILMDAAKRIVDAKIEKQDETVGNTN